MAVWRYDEFLAVREDFIPFSEEVDRNHRENWKFFITRSHAQPAGQTIAALERAHGGDSFLFGSQELTGRARPLPPSWLSALESSMRSRLLKKTQILLLMASFQGVT